VSRLLILVPFLLSILFNLSTLSNGLVYDDPNFFSNTLPRLDLANVWYANEVLPVGLSYYRPASLSFFVIIKSIFGYSVESFHALLLIFHALNASLVYLLTRQLYSANSNKSLVVALLAGSFFAVHPIHIESVAWTAGLLEVNMTNLVLLCLCSFVHFHKNRNLSWLVLSFIFFSLALFSKETAICLIALIPLINYILSRDSGNKACTKKTILYFIASFLTTAVYLWQRQIRTISPGRQQSLEFNLEHLSNLIKSVGYYIGKILFPFEVNPFVTELSFYYLPIGITVIIGTAAILYINRKNKFVLASLSIFWLALAPVFILAITFSSHVIVAERYLYLPSVGFCILLSYTLTYFVKDSRSLIPIALSFCLLPGILSYKRMKIWKNDLTFWTYTTKVSPENFLPWSKLGLNYIKINRCDKAIPLFDKALSLKETLPTNKINSLAITLTNYAICLQNDGDIEKAKKLYLKSLSISKMANTYYNLSTIFINDFELTKSKDSLIKLIHYLKKAVELDKSNAMYRKYLNSYSETLSQLNNSTN